mmetsp:Transcript_6791/g.17038  ORF Transcript_6791/g.17038 Transcript_6791/m.17038 type:complete len:243 (-) Transcript_6791:307-1035(-)
MATSSSSRRELGTICVAIPRRTMSEERKRRPVNATYLAIHCGMFSRRRPVMPPIGVRPIDGSVMEKDDLGVANRTLALRKAAAPAPRISPSPTKAIGLRMYPSREHRLAKLSRSAWPGKAADDPLCWRMRSPTVSKSMPVQKEFSNCSVVGSSSIDGVLVTKTLHVCLTRLPHLRIMSDRLSTTSALRAFIARGWLIRTSAVAPRMMRSSGGCCSIGRPSTLNSGGSGTAGYAPGRSYTPVD